MTPCPNHEGAYDCTPFCELCEGEQEYVSSCSCGQIDSLPFTHDDKCPIWKNRDEDWNDND